MWVALWIVFAIVVAMIAAARGRSAIGWLLVSLVASPLIGGILVLALPSLVGRPTPATHVKCPDCRELVLKDASVCKHCGCRLVPEAAQLAAAASSQIK